MANKLSDEIEVLYQRAGTNAGRLRTEGERAAFVTNVKADIANIVYQYNVVVKPLLQALSSVEGLNALDFGLSGNVMFTHITSSEADALAFYDEDLDRPRTVKETIDVILSELSRLENLIDGIQDATEYDDGELRTLIGENELNLEQLAKDTMGANYTLDGDGAPNLSYSLSQAIDAMGAFFSGFPGTGNTYDTSYPSLTLPTETTLQGAYDLGSAGIGGLISLDVTLGEIRFEAPGPGLGRLFSVNYDTSPDNDLFLIEEDEISIFRVPLSLYRVESIPAGLVEGGQVFTYAENFADVLTTELMYADDLGGYPQITRQGRVREYEMGSQFIYAKDMLPSATPPTRASVGLGASPNNDIIYETIDFPGTGNPTTIYAYISPPIDDEDSPPTAARITLFATPRTNPGAAAGLTFAFKIDHHDIAATVSAEDTEVLIQGNSLAPSWDGHAYNASVPFTIPSDIHKIYIIDKVIQIKGISSSPCLIPFKIQRDPADSGDTYDGDVGVIGMRITWYRRMP